MVEVEFVDNFNLDGDVDLSGEEVIVDAGAEKWVDHKLVDEEEEDEQLVTMILSPNFIKWMRSR